MRDPRNWLALAAVLAVCHLVLSRPASADEQSAPLIDELNDIKANDALTPAERAAALAEVYVSLGAGGPAQVNADKALAMAPHSAFAAFVMAELLAMKGEEQGALELALAKWNDPEIAFEAGMRGGLRHLILGLYFRQGEFGKAEAFLLKEFPQMGADFAAVANGGEPARRYPPHAAQALANIYRATGRAGLAEAPARYARGEEEALLKQGEELQSADRWVAAAAKVGVESGGQVLADLHAAFFSGFQLSWRFNYYYHPIFQPLWDLDDFDQMIAEFEAEAARQRAMIGED